MHHLQILYIFTAVVQAEIAPGIGQTHYWHNIYNQLDVNLAFQQTIRCRKTILYGKRSLQFVSTYDLFI